MSRALDEAHGQFGVVTPQDLQTQVDRGPRDDVARAPDRFQRRGDVGKGLREFIGRRERPAAEARVLRVPGLQVHGQGIDLRGIGDHQDLEVLAVHLVELVRAHAGAFLGERLARIGPQAEARHADEGEIAHARAQALGGQAGDVAAEGKARDAKFDIGIEKFVQARDEHIGDACGRPGLGWHRRLSEARKIRDPELEMLLQHLDVAQPMRPGARAAVQEEERRAAAPDAPHHPAIAGRSRQLAGTALKRLDTGLRGHLAHPARPLTDDIRRRAGRRCAAVRPDWRTGRDSSVSCADR